MVNKDNLKPTLLEIQETAQVMINNIEDVSVLKFFSGKLTILANSVVAYFSESH